MSEGRDRMPTLHDFLSWMYHLKEKKGRMNCLVRISGKLLKKWIGDFAFATAHDKKWKWNGRLFIEQIQISCPDAPMEWYFQVERERRKMFSLFSIAYRRGKITGLSPHSSLIKTGEGSIRAYSDLGTLNAIYKIKLSPISKISSRLQTELVGLSIAYEGKKVYLVGFGNSDIQVLSFHATQEQKMMLVREIEEFLRHERKQEKN